MDSIDLTASTIATAGYRFARAKYTGDDVADPTAPGCAFGCLAAPHATTAQDQSAWELGLRQALATQWAVYGRIGKSFRLMNADEIYESAGTFPFGPQFQFLNPQTARTYEAGVEWRERASSARAAVFRSDVHNEIHLDPFTSGVGNTNLPPSRRQGFELDGRWQAAEGLLLNAGYTYTEAHFLEGTLPGGPFVIGTNMPIAGRRVPLVPRHKFNAGLSCDLAYGTRFSAAWTAVSSEIMDNDEPNTLGRQIPRWNSLDLKLANRQEHFRVALMVNNAFNQGYYTYAVRSNFVPDRYAVYPLAGRTIGVSGEIFLP
jgi:iron complex outermembrane receptor protein